MGATVHLPPGYRLIHFDDIDSTNAEALRQAAKGELGPLWIWADRQVQGRGRLGRIWVSETGNLYASLLVSLPIRPALASGLGIVVSLAVLNTFKAFLPAGVRVEVKWPNDVLIAGLKTAGILIESTLYGHLLQLALGCGLNLRHAPPDTRYGATALQHHAAPVSPPDALQALAEEVDRLLRLWNVGQGFGDIKTEWLRHARDLGRDIVLASPAGDIAGCFEGLGENGTLLLRNRSGLQEFHAGEVSMADRAKGPS